MHFMHPTGSRRFAPTWSRIRSARCFVSKLEEKYKKTHIKQRKKGGGGLINIAILSDIQPNEHVP